MTATHAALKLNEFIESGFYFNYFIMEEAAQCTEIEAFIPLLINSQNRLDHVILIGDHNQLPPIVKNSTLSQHCNSDLSLFSHLTSVYNHDITLDYQGRCRPSLAQLFDWKYPELKSFEFVSQDSFQLANTGLAFDYQFINISEYKGQSEHQPVPHYYQNVGEAEFICLFYMYLRLIGHSSQSISVLTSYSGQRDLLIDVFKHRLKKYSSFYEFPAHVSTIDSFQGRQNDIILLSLVRTSSIGHLSDPRRLVVACSRARLGFYVFGKWELFSHSKPVLPVSSKFAKRPTNLCILPDEVFPSCRTVDDSGEYQVVDGVEHLASVVGFLQKKVVKKINNYY
ncbi:hypothetical protein RCL1_008311 [Eukaryota sp. TZLM3-RCL]